MAKENNGGKGMKNLSNGAKIAILLGMGFISGVLGFLIGKIMKALEKSGSIESIRDGLKSAAVVSVPVLAVISVTVIFTVAIYRYNKAVRTLKTIGEDDEDKLSEVEHSLDLPVTLLNVWTILDMLFLALSVEILVYSGIDGLLKKVFEVSAVAFFIITYAVMFALTRKYIELVKKMNPEKQGDLLDMNFHKEWEDSCDEAQKLIIYKAAYKAFKTANYTCICLWVVCLIAQLAFNAGVLPVICVSAIWLVLTVSYSVESAKLEK